MKRLYDAMDRLDGLATTGDLLSRGVDRGMIDIAAQYRRILRVRKGLWCLPDLPDAVRESLRVKGRLACVSALVHHGVIDDSGFDLHVTTRHGQVSWHPVAQRPGVVRHWSRDPLDGDRFSVSVEVAWAQFAVCGAVGGGEVRLREPDSL